MILHNIAFRHTVMQHFACRAVVVPSGAHGTEMARGGTSRNDEALHEDVFQRRAVEVATQAAGMAFAVERHHAALGRVGRIGNVAGEVASRGSDVAGRTHRAQRLERGMQAPGHARVVHAAHPHLDAPLARHLHEIERRLHAAAFSQLEGVAPQLGLRQRTGQVFGAHDGLVEADG